MRRILITTSLVAMSCHDFGAELAQCIDAGTCIPKGVDMVPTDAKLVVDITGTGSDFSSVPLPVITAPSKTIPIKNAGAKTSGPLSVSLSGTNAATFALANNHCTNQSLNFGQTCTVDVVFNPTQPVMYNAELDVSATPGGTVTWSLTGSGQAPANLQFNPPQQNFMQVQLGMSSTSGTFTLANNGGSPATNLLVSVDDSDAGVFIITSNNCGTTFNAGASCTVIAHFTPTAQGPFSGFLNATSDESTTSVTLLGDGTAPPGAQLFTNSPPVDFSSWQVGQMSTEQQVIVSNVGGQASGPLMTSIGGADPSDFVITQDCTASLTPSGNCTVHLVFSPQATGPRAATLSITANPGGVAQLSLTGTGESSALLSFSPNGWDYTELTAGTVVPKQFTLQNLGTLAATGVGVQVTNLDGGQFVVTANSCPTSLAGGAQCPVTVTFTAPANSGTTPLLASASLVATSSAPTIVAALSGGSLPASSFTFTPPSYDFGNDVNGKATAATAIFLKNVSAIQSGPLSVIKVGTFAPNFTLDASNCTNKQLLSMEQCQLNVSFTPQVGVLGQLQASIQVSANPGLVAAAAVQGKSLTEANLVFAPQNYNFLDTDAGTTSSVNVSLFNIGENPSGVVTFGIMTNDAGVDGGGQLFSVGPGTCVGNQVFNDAGCTQTLYFSPVGYGGAAGTVYAFANDGGWGNFVDRRSGKDGGFLQPDGGPYTADGGAYANLFAFAHGTYPWTFTMFGKGDLTVDGGTVCNGNCTIGLEGGATTYLNAQNPPPGYFFHCWNSRADGGCQDAGSPAFAITALAPGSATVAFDHYNFAFVTSLQQTGNEGMAGYQSCAALAKDAGLPGNYITWRTTQACLPNVPDDGGCTTQTIGFDERPELVGVKGWVRTDGVPFVETFTAAAGDAFVPLSCTEHGIGLDPAGPAELAWSGENLTDGGYAPGTTHNCAGWTNATSTFNGYVGSVFGVGKYATDLSTQTCDKVVRRFCVETDRAWSILPLRPAGVPVGGRRAFVMTNSFTGDAGATAVNGECGAEAADAGLPNFANFIALRGTSTVPAMSLLSSSGGDWYRVDGFRVLSVASLLDGGQGLEAPLYLTARGVRVSGWGYTTQVWVGDSAASCSNWTRATTSFAGTTGNPESTDVGWRANSTSQGCNGTHPFYCFEN